MPSILPSRAFHRNQQLFSDYYLNERLPARDDYLFHLAPADIKVIEDNTKYRYGEV